MPQRYKCTASILTILKQMTIDSNRTIYIISSDMIKYIDKPLILEVRIG